MLAPLPSSSRRPAWFLPAFALAYVGGVTAYLPLLSLLLPLKIGAMAGDSRLGVLTASVVAGALAASVANIVFGMLSDRSLARGGGRRRWLAGGVAAMAAAYAGIAAADTAMLVVVAVAVFQVAVNALLAPLLAIMADEVPDAQKGLAGGLLALGAPAASGVGVLLVGADGLGDVARWAIVPLVSAACIVPLLLLRPSAALSMPGDVRTTIPRRNLLIAWTARLLVQVAGTVLSTYLLFYFESVAPSTSPAALAARVARLLLIAALLPLPVALLAGRLSDRTGRRKPVLFSAACVASLGLAGMACAHDWAAGATGFALYTIGSSVFLALHSTFAMQLLPHPQHRGRDLGLLNLTNTLPALIGPLLAWALATPRNFAPLLVVLAALMLGGGAAMLGVRGRRWRRPQ